MGHNELLIGDALRGRSRDDVADQRQVRRPARPGRRLARLRRQPGRGQDLRSPTRCSGSAPTTSTSTARRGSTPTCRSRRPSARSPSWSRPATSATSASPRSAPTRSAAPRRSHPITDLQIEYSLISRGIEDEILADLPRARHRHHRLRRALARPALRPLARRAATAAAATSAPHSPRFQGEQPRAQPRRWSTRCARSPTSAALTVAQVAIAWVLARGEDIVPLVGARRRDRLSEALGALDVDLDAATLAAHRGRRPAGRRRRRPLRRAADGDARLRALDRRSPRPLEPAPANVNGGLGREGGFLPTGLRYCGVVGSCAPRRCALPTTPRSGRGW